MPNPEPDELLGKYVRFEYFSGVGGAGKVVAVDRSGPVPLLTVDYGYGFPLTADCRITISDEPPDA